MDKKEITPDDCVSAIINIPKNAVALIVNAKLLDDDTNEIYKAEMKINHSLLLDCIIMGEEWVHKNATYELTEKGRQLLNEIQNK